MRLTQTQIKAIKTSATEVFGDAAEVWLFGSRVDNDRRGGDIDLYLELPPMDEAKRHKLETRFWVRLQRLLGERRVDIVSHQQGAPLRRIDQQARQTGIRL